MSEIAVEAAHLPPSLRQQYLARRAAAKTIEVFAGHVGGQEAELQKIIETTFLFAGRLSDVHGPESFDLQVWNEHLLKSDSGSAIDRGARLIMGTLSGGSMSHYESPRERVMNFSIDLVYGPQPVNVEVTRIESRRDQQAHYSVHSAQYVGGIASSAAEA